MVSPPAPPHPAPPALVVGLGNPGGEYRGTRHNFGFDVLDRLASVGSFSWKRARFTKADTCRTSDGLWLVKPLTYMNLSGEAVAAALKWFRLSPEQLVVVVDDVNLPVGQLRLRPSGSSGGHNGLKSIEQRLGTSGYPRLRGGVGAPVHAGAMKRHVLEKFEPEEKELIEQAIQRAVSGIQTWRTSGIDAAMNQLNSKL